MLGNSKFVRALNLTKENIYQILSLVHQLAAYLIRLLVERSFTKLKKGGKSSDGHSD